MNNLKYTHLDTRNKINFLVESDLNLLFVIYPDNDVQWFIVDAFEAPTAGSVSSVPYMQFRGIDVTPFIRDNIFNIANNSHFMDQLTAFLSKEKQILMKFSENHHWGFFTR